MSIGCGKAQTGAALFLRTTAGPLNFREYPSDSPQAADVQDQLIQRASTLFMPRENPVPSSAP